MRRQGASIFIYLIFGLLIVIFVINFAPSKNRGDASCGVSSNSVMTVDGQDTSQTAFHIAYSAGGGTGRQKVYVALENLIRRELLAQAAADHGIRTTGDMVDEEIKRGKFFLGGHRIDMSNQFFDDVDGEKFFNIKRLKGWVNSLNVQSVGSYRDEQARGLQAALMADLITHSVKVSREEALSDYLYENNTVTYDVVTFDPSKYRVAMKLTDADVKRFLEGHDKEVHDRFKADERTYKAVKPQLKVREIYIPKAVAAAEPPPPAPAPPAEDKKPADDKKADDKKADAKTDKKPADAAKKDDKKADDKTAAKKADDKTAAKGDAPKPFGLAVDAAKAKLEALRTQITSGKLKFADAEKQVAADASDDDPANNGDRGWRSADNAQLGDKAVNDAVKALKPGEVTPVIATDKGVYLLTVEDKREGDLSFDQVKTEIATELAKDVWSKEAAKRAAIDALAKAKADKKNLDQMFERELVKPQGGGLQDILNDQSLTPEQKQQILEQLQKQMEQNNGKHGSLEVHEEDVPVGWFAPDEPSGSAAAAPAGSAAAPAAGSAAAPAAGSAAGSGAGSAAPTPPAAPPAPPPPPSLDPSKDVLPAFGEIPKAKINRFGPAPRHSKMPGIGGTKDAIDALFDVMSPGDLAKSIFDGEAGYTVVQLINRSQPKVEDFDKKADAELSRMQEARGQAALKDWLKNRCETLAKANKIRPSQDLIHETDDKGNPAPQVYHPCMYFEYL